MNYRLLTQLGVGKDGAAYRAEALADGAALEVRLLGGARGDPDHWAGLVKRLRRAALLDHPSARRVQELDLAAEPPALTLDWVDGEPLASALRERLPLPAEEVARLGYELADVLAAAHRFGLAHGQLAPGTVLRTAAGRLQVDFTGTDVTAAAEGASPGGEEPDAAADLRALGLLLVWLLTARESSAQPDGAATLPGELNGPLAELLPGLLAPDPADRPSARDAAERLWEACPAPASVDSDLFWGSAVGVTIRRARRGVPAEEDPAPSTETGRGKAVPGERLGRYRLLEKVGEGGMGAVYRAEDTADGTVVAVKVLRPDLVQRPDSLRRFHKEARLLAEVNNPHVTNLLEVNEDDGTHYLVLEYVPGQTLRQLLEGQGALDERTALGVAADVARALAEAHERGIVHRDVKPENVLLVDAPSPAAAAGLRVKLSDFGLARHLEESESLALTRTGAVVGTPLYMAPEQGTGQAPVDARADVYALGATLFHLLAGRPPFLGDTPFALITRHANEPPPSLQKLNPAVSEAACRVVEKCLAKTPDQRYLNAGELLTDLERLLRGEPAALVLHPRLPECDPAKVIHYDWSWELDAPPQQLWPYVSNTERLNRAAGVPAVQFTTRPEPGRRVRRFGRFRKAGLTAAWEEHPFEWVEGRRFGVLRAYHEGPFKWIVATVELEPRLGGGTRLSARVRIEPHGLLGRTAAAVEVGLKGRRALDRIYRRIDAALTGKLGNPALVDPFEPPAPLSAGRRRRLEELLDGLGKHGLDPALVERLGTFLAEAPAQEVARIRPLALARRLALDPEQVVAACLHGSREGLLVLLWDILCPVCRIPTQVKETLKALREHDHCAACDLDFRLDFANSIEMIFRAHPEIRDAELGTYCIGGPAHSPHVVAQVRVGPGERLQLDLDLPEGAYRLRGPQLPFAHDFRVQPGAGRSRLDVPVGGVPGPDAPRVLRAGRQQVVLTNDRGQELLVRVERTAPRADALTAARASALALFRELFPGEVLSPGQLVSVANVTLLVTDLDRAGDLYEVLGDGPAFTRIHECFRLVGERVRQEGGAVVKTVGEGLVAVFSEPAAAVRAALDLPALVERGEATRGLRLRVAVHRGPALAATLNDHLDYFGATVNQAAQLPRLAGPGDVLLTAAVAGDARVAALLRQRGLEAQVLRLETARPALGPLHRVRPGGASG
jgi:serine/threonine protein kinase/class 3 adenylate cyclase